VIDVKQAVKAAISYVRDFRDILPDQDLRLEETELVDDGGLGAVWLITLGMRENPFSGEDYTFRQFVVDAQDGTVKAMKSRLPLGS
jgi:hypothetical protein